MSKPLTNSELDRIGVKIGDAIIYEGMNGEIVIDSE